MVTCNWPIPCTSIYSQAVHIFNESLKKLSEFIVLHENLRYSIISNSESWPLGVSTGHSPKEVAIVLRLLCWRKNCAHVTRNTKLVDQVVVDISAIKLSKSKTIHQGVLASITPDDIIPIPILLINPVDACRGFPTQLTPRGWRCCIIRILEECSRLKVNSWSSFTQAVIGNKGNSWDVLNSP